MSSPTNQASPPPAAVMATTARKIGLGRTDWRSGRMFTSRSYLQPALGMAVEGGAPHGARSVQSVADHQSGDGDELRGAAGDPALGPHAGRQDAVPQARHGRDRLDPDTGHLAVEQRGVVDGRLAVNRLPTLGG